MFLVGAFSPFTFKVIIVTYVLTAILLTVLDLLGFFLNFLIFFFGFLLVFFLPFFSCGLMTIFSFVFVNCFFLFVCVSIVDFWFAVTLKFWYRSLSLSLYIYIYIHTHKHIYMCVCVYTHIHTQSCCFLIASASPGSCICPVFSRFLILVAYLCANDFLPLLYICLFWWTLLFVIFSFLVVAFST